MTEKEDRYQLIGNAEDIYWMTPSPEYISHSKYISAKITI